ncbi:ATP-binding cassette transporter C [Pleurotus pulmonarius]
MPRFQLEVAAALVASVLPSLVAFYVFRPREGKIQLPIHSEGNGVQAHEHDPFDVLTREDVVEGEPIEETAFWARMRLIKLVISCLFATIIVLEAISLGYYAVLEIKDQIPIYTLHLFFALYLLVLSVRSVKQNDINYHGESMLHLSTLTALANGLLLGTTILPATPPPVAEAFSETEPVLEGLWYSILTLYFIACAICFTTPQGPTFYYPPERIYSEKVVANITNSDRENVCGIIGASSWDTLLFSYTTKVVMLGNVAESLDIGDLPIVPSNMRATVNYTTMKNALRNIKAQFRRWKPKPGSGWALFYRLCRINAGPIGMEIGLAVIAAVLFYCPAIFLRQFIQYLELDPLREDKGWGWVYVVGLFSSNAIAYLVTGQLWSLATTIVQCRLRLQLNSVLFAKTLVRKDVASSAAAEPGKTDATETPAKEKEEKKDEDDFSSKAQIMTLMTTDVDRVSDFAWHMFSLVDAPIEIVIGTIFLYKLLGESSFYGLAVTCLFLPMNHFAGKIVVGAQDNLMKARDERVSLMNEILGGIRMLKFMAWERSFEARVLKVREKELKYQKLNYTIETLWNAIWNGSPVLVTLVSFWHFAVYRQQILTPSIAFTSLSIFTEMRFALNALPETFINLLQTFVSLRRIEKYLGGSEVTLVPPLDHQSKTIAFQSATVTWPQERAQASVAPSAAPTPRHKFLLVDLTLQFPPNELTLVCGKLGSGKTLLLLGLLGEADILTGQVLCPRSPPDALASYAGKSIPKEDWVVEGVCAYVPQAAWLRNASIKDNILFNLPYDEERYQKTLEVCALISDLQILEDGDESEIGERGVNLSGGQKARVSLARAVYSRASILLLDDVLSAVDAHTAHHLYNECITGPLMRGRTVILVSHHVQLCTPGAGYIVALENGRIQYQGDRQGFQASSVMQTLVQSSSESTDEKEEAAVEDLKLSSSQAPSEAQSTTDTTVTAVATPSSDKKAPRKLVEEEKRAVGRISRDVWSTYIHACGHWPFWVVFILILLLAALSPVLENGWLRHWSGSEQVGEGTRSPLFYISVYAVITMAGIIIGTIRWFVLYRGSINASIVLYQRLLEAVLFANIRFHDTVSRGRLLNRFGKDFEGIDSSLADNFGRSIINGMSVAITVVTVSAVGGLPFIIAVMIIGTIYFNVAKVYGQTSRDMRRLDSVTRSPLYSIYGETISGVTIIRAFGASSKFLRDMLRFADTNANPYYWMWGVNRWLSARFNLLSSAIVGVTALVALITPRIDASLAGFALAFASSISGDLLFLVRRFVALEQSMVALERVKEYTDLRREPPEFIEPRPPSEWPQNGGIKCEGLVIRYAPELPDVLHNLNFEVYPGEKIGILGRTGSGKSTLALSFFRFVEATEGRILVDDIDIAKVGLTDLRSKLTIIPQDPTILSGTLRTTLDVFSEYEDAEIYEALRRVHLIPSEDTPEEAADTVNANVFRNLDSPVSEGGENFSTGEKQLLCMARAILKRSKVLVMDEKDLCSHTPTFSVDYATDELIGKTIRHEFAEGTILTIAHRLRTVIDYDRVMLLDAGRIAEFDKPAVLLNNPASKFYSLCKATGKDEFQVLRKLAGAN